jgi:hypothetical protein
VKANPENISAHAQTERIAKDFAFQLSRDEFGSLMSRIVISKDRPDKWGE